MKWHTGFMVSFSIGQTLTGHLKSLQSAVSEKYAQVKNIPLEELEGIHRYARISMIGASTRIENAVLTDSEVSWLDTLLGEDGKTTAFQDKKQMIENKLSKDKERSIEEVAGCRAMLALIYEHAKELMPLTETHIRGLHHELLASYEKARHYLGQYKKSPNSVVEHNHTTGKQRVVFKTADPGPITAAAMADLVKWYNAAIKEYPWSIAVASEFTFRFLAIHPFQDGNGRLGRGLFLLSLLHCPDPHLSFLAKYLAIDRHIEKHKEDYYHVLNRCSDGIYRSDPRQYHIEYFLNFMIKVLNAAISDIDFYRKKIKAFQDLSAAASKVLACFKDQPETKLQTSDLVHNSQLPRRTVSNGLIVLLREGFIQRYGKGRSVRYQLIF